MMVPGVLGEIARDPVWKDSVKDFLGPFEFLWYLPRIISHQPAIQRATVLFGKHRVTASWRIRVSAYNLYSHT